MKHKFFFFLPRLAGLTLLVGLASLVLFLLFKLLLLAIVTGVIIAVAAKILSGVRKKWMTGYQLEHGPHQHFSGLSHNSTINPVMQASSQGIPAIIPIN
ncbi:hypothetical protein [Niabella drilacis]|uniref:Uncharacterized protein n=1 Tax=Niabella drilacis (strain DSM 25811 / CCM 8410 / CCUG 62505 / LMG 26954 / E90) TaxID=1285928 RepID=A0A1G6J4F5_NIADE|nr:hypothetical protein [Niabella drilacis]SDC12826.1 hypothetical protein SAMN04487894_101397 [Niabella drilacis]